MQLSFTQLLGDSLFNSYDISTLDIEKFLNMGQDNFVELWYNKFEQDEQARKRLSPLVKTVKYNRTTGEATSLNVFWLGESWKVPEDCRYVLHEMASFASGIYLNSNFVEVKPVNLDYINKHQKNSYKKPYNSLVWRLDLGNKRHLLITNSTNIINEYAITYLSNPLPIKLLTGDPKTNPISIAPEYRQEIVNLALETAINILSKQKQEQTNQT